MVSGVTMVTATGMTVVVGRMSRTMKRHPSFLQFDENFKIGSPLGEGGQRL
jgi:hypothetical protein